MRIADGNFSSPEEKSAFLEKFDLAYYNKEMEEALALTGSDDAEQVELAYGEALKHAASIDRICFEYVPDEWNSVSDHHVIHEMITPIPNEYDRSMIVVKDARSGICDVILPGGAMAGGFINMPDGERKMYRIYPEEVMSKDERRQAKATLSCNGIRGMSKERISLELMNDGAKYVRFYNRDGKLSLKADDSYYDGKTVHEMIFKGGKLSELARIDVSEAVAAVNTLLFDKVMMLKDDNSRWAFYIKPKDEPSFCIYPEKEDTNRFFSTIRQGHQEEGDRLRMELGLKYYEIVKANPELRFDIFNDVPDGVDLSRISRVNVYKTKEDKIMCAPKIEGAGDIKPREISRDQWSRMFVAEDMAQYKTSLAAKVFADMLGAKASQSEAVATDSVKPEARVESVEADKPGEVEEMVARQGPKR